MIKVNQNHIEPIAKLLTACFLDDPLTTLQTQGLTNEEEISYKLLKMLIEIFTKTRDVYSLDEQFKTVIIGYEKEKLKLLKQMILSMLATQKIRQEMSKADFKRYVQNVRRISKAVKLNWYKQFVKKNYYHINCVAVAEEERGKGRMRALMTPIIESCKERNIPIVLETVNSHHIPMYEHMGFQWVKTMEDTTMGLKMYCFINHE